MKRKSQLLALLMALCLLASLTVLPAAADEISEDDTTQTTPEQCEHGNDPATCEKCHPELAKCEHGNDPATCEKCHPELAKCEHGNDPATCEKCHPELAKCEHGNDPATCEKCHPELAKCEHGNDPATCEKCHPELAKCEHGNNPATCEKCHPELAKCEHGNNPSTCPVCHPSTLGKPTSSDLSYPSYVEFDKVEKGATGSDLTKTFTITNRSKYDMTLSASSVSGYTVTGFPSALKAGDSKTVTVSLNSAKTTGTYNKTLTFSASFDKGSGSASFSISLYAEVVEKGNSISVTPTSKDLGKLKEGYSEKTAEEKEITVTVENKGAYQVRMNGVKGNDHFIVTCVKDEGYRLDSGEKVDYKIVPKQDLKVGTYTDKIVFQTREGATAEFKATVVIEKKLDPLAVDPGTLDFGAAEEGYAALTPKTVTLKNNTEYALKLEQPTSFSYEISMLTQSSLPSGASTTFTIRPRTGMPQGAYSGVIDIVANGERAKLNVRFTVNAKSGPSTYPDVASGSTFAADIAYVSQKGLMGGKSDGNFKPQESITRGQLVTILYRLEGQPAVSGAGFPDVATGSYCDKAVKWAAANGITAGGKDGNFKPNDPITREQLATFLYRYNNYKGYQVAKQADLSKFSDGASVASYAKDALSWANGVGLVNGTSDGRLNPSGGATRGQAAAILHRFCVSIGK